MRPIRTARFTIVEMLAVTAALAVGFVNVAFLFMAASGILIWLLHEKLGLSLWRSLLLVALLVLVFAPFVPVGRGPWSLPVPAPPVGVRAR